MRSKLSERWAKQQARRVAKLVRDQRRAMRATAKSKQVFKGGDDV